MTAQRGSNADRCCERQRASDTGHCSRHMSITPSAHACKPVLWLLIMLPWPTHNWLYSTWLLETCPWAVGREFLVIQLKPARNSSVHTMQASLPLAKLCAMVTMQKRPGPTVQSFSLPLQLVQGKSKVRGGVGRCFFPINHSIYIIIYPQQSGESGGILDISVKYEVLIEGDKGRDYDSAVEKTHITLSFEIHRAAGLKVIKMEMNCSTSYVI